MGQKLTIENINKRKPENSFLTAVSIIKRNWKTYVICECICGSRDEFFAFDVANGTSKSCGCKKGELITSKITKYPGNIKQVYSAYNAMIGRCYKPQHKYYPNYGGRGVRVCEEWLKDYMSFLNWSKANGWAKGLEIDKDTLGNGLLYSPSTSCWITKRENNLKRKDSRLVMYKGDEVSVAELSRRLGVPKMTLAVRLNNGWTEDELSLPAFDRIRTPMTVFKNDDIVGNYSSVKDVIKNLGGHEGSWNRVRRGERSTYMGYTMKKTSDA